MTYTQQQHKQSEEIDCTEIAFFTLSTYVAYVAMTS